MCIIGANIMSIIGVTQLESIILKDPQLSYPFGSISMLFASLVFHRMFYLIFLVIYWICLDFFPKLLKNPIFQYFSVNDSLAFQSALGQLGNVVHRDYRGNQIYSKFAGLQEEESLHRFQVHEPMNYHQLDHCYYWVFRSTKSEDISQFFLDFARSGNFHWQRIWQLADHFCTLNFPNLFTVAFTWKSNKKPLKYCFYFRNLNLYLNSFISISKTGTWTRTWKFVLENSIVFENSNSNLYFQSFVNFSRPCYNFWNIKMMIPVSVKF